MSTSTSLNLSSESTAEGSGAVLATPAVTAHESRSSSLTPRGRGRSSKPPSALARAGLGSRSSSLVRPAIKPKKIKDIFTMNDPSTLPFSAGELPDETMQKVAVIQTPDHPPTAGSADPNGPRIELHRHESYHQLNQVNVPKVELHFCYASRAPAFGYTFAAGSLVFVRSKICHVQMVELLSAALKWTLFWQYAICVSLRLSFVHGTVCIPFCVCMEGYLSSLFLWLCLSYERWSPVRNPGRGGCIPGWFWTSGSKTPTRGDVWRELCRTEVAWTLCKDDTA